MSEDVQKPITPEIARMCDLLDLAIKRFLKARDEIPSWGGYEAQDEAHIMLLYSLRCIESLIAFACKDLVLLPAAMLIARTILDTGIKLLWMLQPTDLFACEARWLTLMNAEYTYLRKSADLFQQEISQLAKHMHKEAAEIRTFYEDVKAELERRSPKRYKVLKEPPTTREMLRVLGDETSYFLFMCQVSNYHPTGKSP
ncbi:MAG: hypothetical protein U0670_14235 [Anaerolineae bacterium]